MSVEEVDMLKHIDDEAELNILIDDGGVLLVICSGCKKIWQGKLTLAESPTSVKKPTKQMMIDALMAKPSLLKDVGIDMKSIAALKLR
jgi:hypothetical protein